MNPQTIPAAALVEVLAKLEHDQWMHWSQAVAAEVSATTRARWQAAWIPYADLTDELKEADRVWARKVVARLSER